MTRMPLRLALASIMLAAFAAAAAAQVYTSTKTVGQQPYTATLRPNAVLLLKGPADDTLTAWQPLPFAWSLYGRPVTGYRASDNGYITFDSLAAVSVPANLGAAAPGAPDNAIYAYWDNLHFSNISTPWSNEIRSITIGSAPDRAHVVAWISAVPEGKEWSTADNLAFAIALKEQGGFAVVQIAGRKTVRNMTGSIGCENADGTLATFVDGSPALDYPELTSSADDDITYDFQYRETPLDLAVISSALPRMVKAGEAIPVTGVVQNVGTDTVTAYTVRYNVRRPGFPPVAEGRVDRSGIALASNRTDSITFPQPATLPDAGVMYAARIWTEAPNGRADGFPGNDTLAAQIFSIVGSSTERRALVEEFTGAWCAWCPDGGLQMQALAAAHPTATLVSIHAGGVDSMRTAAGDYLATLFKPAYPQAMIDRVRFPGEKGVPINRTDNAWLLRTGERASAWTPLSVALTTGWDAATRTVHVTAAATTVDFPYPGDLRMNAWILEDPVTGSGTGYDQRNAYSNNANYPNHPYFGQPDPMTNFPHRHVLRSSLTGTLGVANVLPVAPSISRTYTYRDSAVLPVWIDERHVTVVAFVSCDSGEVLNSASAPLLGADDAPPPPLPGDAAITIAPHPVASAGVIRCEAARGADARVSIVDALGRLRAEWTQPAGSAAIPFSVEGWERGLYLIRVRAGASVSARPFVVTRGGR